jgi:uncharacterized repeat protein (TIGR03803 family)
VENSNRTWSFARKALWFFVVACSFIAAIGRAQISYERISSFGPQVLPGSEPHAALIQGLDGALYGTTQAGGISNAGVVFKINCDGSGFSFLHIFTNRPDGAMPYGQLAQTADGLLFGLTVYGGSNNFGAVFTLDTIGNNFAIIHHFSTNRLDGEFPRSGLFVGKDGRLYGTASGGGTNGFGAVFALNPNGTGFTLLHSFVTNSFSTDGKFPDELIQETNGLLYGSTRQSGTLSSFSPGAPMLFALTTNGTGYTQLKTFSTPPPSARSHHNGLIQGTNGMLFGTVHSDSGIAAPGGIFTIATNGSGYLVLHPFTTNIYDGQNPDGRLVQANDGLFYGTTVKGGTNDYGSVFKMNADGTGFVLLHSFAGFPGDGQWPSDRLIQGTDGNLYGITLLGGTNNEGTVFKISTDGQTYSVLYSFVTRTSDGQLPLGKLVKGSDGLLYGTTVQGGSNNLGTIFKIDPVTTNRTLLHTFGAANDGQQPFGRLVQGVDGSFYGTTSTGGTNGFGTVFQISGDGSQYAVLYSFSNSPDGSLPSGTLVQGPDGLLYGVTGAGGTSGVGTIFTIQTNGSAYSVLYNFSTNGTDGLGPVGGLIFGTNGALFGTAGDGGPNGGGAVFTIGTDGNGYALLHTFNTNGTDGMTPFGGLFQGPDGVLYGTTRLGGSSGFGTVFRLNPDGSGYAVLRNFTTANSDGLEPVGELVEGHGGILYGVTSYGGAGGAGSVFQIRNDGLQYGILQNFSSTAGGGRSPSAGVFRDTDGSLYGTTEFGGNANAGSAFKLSIGSLPTIIGQPQNQFVLLGGNALFSVSAVGDSLGYQWYYNNNPITNASDFTISVTNVLRTNGGIYTVAVSNLLSGVTSSNAVLTVQVPQTLSGSMILPDGSFGVASAYLDGYPLTPADVSRFEAQASSNLVSWSTLSNSLTYSNGGLVLDDLSNTNQSTRFYRIIEH